MSTPLEDYALLSDMHTGPLVSRDGSIDWLCLPRFDSAAVFSAILGDADDGRWKVSIKDGEVVRREYEPATFVLQTTWHCPTGTALVTDFLPPTSRRADIVRRVECLEGEVVIEHDLRIRFSYARATPWFRRVDDGPGGACVLVSVAGPDGVVVSGPTLRPVKGGDGGTVGEGDGVAGDAPVERPHERHTEPHDVTRDVGAATQEAGAAQVDHRGEATPRLGGRFRVTAGQVLTWDLTWFPSWEDLPDLIDTEKALADTRNYWRQWASKVDVNTAHDAMVLRSLLVLRALTHLETGGIVAAPTASLPEEFGGSRNWDYRYTWLRDAALTIEVLVEHGFTDGAKHWRDWLLRSIAGDVEDLRIMYGLAGERDLDEKELDHLSGYENSRPVRIGNGAAGQYQADVPGEVMIALAMMRDAGVEENDFSWGLQKGLLRYCEDNFDRKDHGIWEMRGETHYFTHGRVMMWAAFNEGVRAVEEHGLEGDAERWRELRDRLREEILTHGYDEERGTFTQTYDTAEVDASLLQLPHTMFVGYDDERMLGTVAAIEQDLQGPSGLLHRYRTEAGLDGLEGDEYPFLICAFWLVEQYARSGRVADAVQLMDTLVAAANDVGLLAEEFDPDAGRLAGNFPQAFSHLGLIRAADALRDAGAVDESIPPRPGHN